MKKVWGRLLIIFAFICGLLSFVPPILTGNYFFTFDGARDLIWVKNQVDFLKPSLIGPWGSITGVFFGPLWFWILTIPYILGGGDPRIITLFSGLLIFSTGIIAYYLLKKHLFSLAFFTLVLGFTSPAILSLSEFAFSQHLLILLTFLLIYSFAQILSAFNRKYFLLALLSISLMFHAEPPTAIFSLPPLVIITILSTYRKKYLTPKNLLLGLVVFVIPFIPQIIFELRHDFIQTHALIEFIKGTNTSLQGVLPFDQRINDRIYKFLDAFHFATLKDYFYLSLILLSAVLSINFKMVKDKFLRNLWRGSLIYVASLFLLFIYFKPELKGFYLEGILFIFLLWLSLSLSSLWEKKIYRGVVVGLLIVFILISTKPYNLSHSFKSSFGGRDKISGVFRNNLSVVDFIYQDAKNQGFRVYTYDPGIYDYSYQYIFLWRGPKKYNYLPADFSYLPNVPEYVQFKNAQLDRLKDKIRKSDGLIYFIIQKGGEKAIKESWFANFPDTKYKLIDQKLFPDGTLVEKREEI